MIEEAISILSDAKDLTSAQMQAVMEEIVTGKPETPQIVSFLKFLNKKGETAEELTAAVRVLRQHSSKIHTNQALILDTCGTGGDKKCTFNISTVSAFVASGCGITVAKHGNRSVSSVCGSADILEALGIDINISKEKMEKCLDEIGIAFLFAQNLHPAMKYAMPARKEIGARTIFNILGPLTNPADATHQLVGVFQKSLTGILAQVLANLGTVHALVVHGEDGLDEITTTGKTFISESRHGKVSSYEIEPRDFRFEKARLEDLSGKDASYNAGILLDLLNGQSGPKRDIVLLNAAAAIYAADKVNSIKEGIELAKDSIDSRKALKKLELLKEYSLKN
ncbi:MAG: anthranilate phosphoribosyltransferase [Candidatus Omnitrophica bacterium]|nr:anthranilate phosphoribosyltransferase [Candidatus Omnitrophota bacterium]MDD5237377.1 anthranilate phosphoribosyltransferase [Candidatus Omnitrophota bacterium]